MCGKKILIDNNQSILYISILLHSLHSRLWVQTSFNLPKDTQSFYLDPQRPEGSFKDNYHIQLSYT